MPFRGNLQTLWKMKKLLQRNATNKPYLLKKKEMIAKIAPIKPLARVMLTILFEKAQAKMICTAEKVPAMKICSAAEFFDLDFCSMPLQH